jgi:hypothetical protein
MDYLFPTFRDNVQDTTFLHNHWRCVISQKISSLGKHQLLKIKINRLLFRHLYTFTFQLTEKSLRLAFLPVRLQCTCRLGHFNASVPADRFWFSYSVVHLFIIACFLRIINT